MLKLNNWRRDLGNLDIRSSKTKKSKIIDTDIKVNIYSIIIFTPKTKN